MNPAEAPPFSAVPEDDRRRDDHRRRTVALGLGILFLGSGAGLAGLVTQPWVRPAPMGTATPADPLRLEAHVRRLAERCTPRDGAHPQGLARAAEDIAGSLRASGARVAVQGYEVRGRSFRNVIGSFGAATGPRIVVGAHYDAYGNLPGADDNASGVAGLLELARLLGTDPAVPRVDLVAYTLEERPFFGTPEMGSVRHARWLRETGAEVTAVIVLEMIGRFSDAPDSQRLPWALLAPFYPSRGTFIAVAGRFDDIGLTRAVKGALRAVPSLPVVSLNGPRWVPGMDFSDHYPYWDQGFPAVMVTDTAFYRNGDYHTAKDTADRLDYARMAQVVQGLHAAVLHLGKRAH